MRRSRLRRFGAWADRPRRARGTAPLAADRRLLLHPCAATLTIGASRAGAGAPWQGHVAEWLRSGLQNRLRRFNSGRGLHSLPAASA